MQLLFGLLTSRNVKNTQRTLYTTSFFYFVSKEATHKLLKLAAAKTLFYSVYVIRRTNFDECFLFHVITENCDNCHVAAPQYF